ncbi:Ribonuclease H [Abeliophyllum distichum]|uniref:Ribonuclease H n=1 Tax=Abeliophyllum distichum TaxID=126358 RepID=A0ABD1RZP4_9LAMI
MTCRSKITCEELSKGKQPQRTSADVKVLRKELTFPIPNIGKLALPYQLVTVPETSNVSTSISSIEKLCISNSSKQNMPHVKEVEDPKQTFKGHYNPQVKKLFKNAGFGKGEPRKLGDLDAVLLDGRVPSDSGGSFIAQPKYGLRYNSGLPRKIKVKKVSLNPIMIQIYETVEDKLKDSRPSVFDRIQSENVRVLVFERLERETSKIVNPRGRMSVFQRLSGDSSTYVQIDKDTQASSESFQRQSIFSQLGVKTSNSYLKPQQSRKKNKNRRTVPTQKNGEEKEEVSINHIAFEEASDSDSEFENSTTVNELESAPPTFEEGGQANVDDLKQLNLVTEEDMNRCL